MNDATNSCKDPAHVTSLPPTSISSELVKRDETKRQQTVY